MKTYLNTETTPESNELDALIQFTQNRWSGIPSNDSADIITKSFNAGLEAGALWFDQYGFLDASKQWEDERTKKLTAILKTQNPDFVDHIHYDDILSFGKNIWGRASTLYRIIMSGWDYSEKADSLYKTILASHPNAKDFKPHGFDEFKKTYQDFDGADEYFDSGNQKKDINDFNGVNSSTAGSDGFHSQLAVHTVTYNDVCQGRNHIRTLVAAAFSHGLFIAQHNNTAAMLADMENCKNILFNNPDHDKITYLHDSTAIPANKILKCILFVENFQMQESMRKISGLRTYKTQAELDSYLVQRTKEIKAITPEQKAESKKNADKWLKNFFAELASPEEKENEKKSEIALRDATLDFLKSTKSNKRTM